MGIIKFLGYVWALPPTLLGFLLLLFPSKGKVYWKWKDGALDVIPRDEVLLGSKYGGITFGWMIIFRDSLNLSHPPRRFHERVHVRQYLKWGPLFIPIYVLNFIWNWMFGLRMNSSDAYSNIYFEKVAARETLKEFNQKG